MEAIHSRQPHDLTNIFSFEALNNNIASSQITTYQGANILSSYVAAKYSGFIWFICHFRAFCEFPNLCS